MTEGHWELRVRDPNRELVATIDDYSQAVFEARFNDVGAWIIKGMPVGSDATAALVPGAGIVALRDGIVEMAGPLLFPTFRWSAKGYVLDASGASDDLALAARLAYPDAPSLNLNGAYSDDRTGMASTIMRQYVNVNAGPGADATRRWAGLTLDVDPGLGSTVSYSARNDLLLDLLRQLANVDTLGFRIVQDDNSTDLLFQVYDPADRTTTAIFSPQLGNLAEYLYSVKAPQTNFVVVGGGGDGVARLFSAFGDNASIATWGMRLEGFVDQRQTTDATALVQAGEDELAQKSSQTAVELTPVDTTAMSYRTAYALGDLVSVRFEGVTVNDVVRAISFTLDTGGERIVPTVGTPGAAIVGSSERSAVDLLLARMQTLSRRLSRLAAAQ